MNQRVIPKTAYNLAVAIIRDYPRKLEYLEVIGKMKKRDELNELVMEEYRDHVNRLEDCVEASLPEFMRKGILNHIIHNAKYPNMYYEEHTWQRYNQKFILAVAKEFGVYRWDAKKKERP